MFIGHYGVSFAAKPLGPRVPLWVWFIAVQWLDVVWSILVPLGVEKLRIVPGYTEANALELYYMPYTHSLPGSIVLSLIFGGIVAWFVSRESRQDIPAGGRRGVLALDSRSRRRTRRTCRCTTTALKSASGCGSTWR